MLRLIMWLSHMAIKRVEAKRQAARRLLQSFEMRPSEGVRSLPFTVRMVALCFQVFSWQVAWDSQISLSLSAPGIQCTESEI